MNRESWTALIHVPGAFLPSQSPLSTSTSVAAAELAACFCSYPRRYSEDVPGAVYTNSIYQTVSIRRDALTEEALTEEAQDHSDSSSPSHGMARLL